MPQAESFHRGRVSAVLRGWLYPAAVAGLLLGSAAQGAPRVVLISLDGATPTLIDEFLADGTLTPRRGIGLLKSAGVYAASNQTVTPSLTAPGHIAIATGASAARNDVVANTFLLIASPFSNPISGFGAPIGGYDTQGGPHESAHPTAEPLWVKLRAAGKKVVTATFPGSDGVDVKVPGLAGSPVIQPAQYRTVDYTIPYGTATAPFQKGFTLGASDFTAAPAATVSQLAAAGRTSFSPVLEAHLETFTSSGVPYAIKVAALDTSNDGRINYDTLVLFDQAQGIQPGPFPLPSTGPAYIKPSDKISALFYLEGHPQKAGVRYFVTYLAPDLSTVRLARSSTTYISRTAISPSVPQVLADIDDILTHVGFWQPQPDYRIVEKLDATPSTFASFPDAEIEAIYEELVTEWVKYQTEVAKRAIARNPDADLVMTYIEQPDGSEHQFLLTDPRQPSDPHDPNSIGSGQDPAKVARYWQYIKKAYQAADQAVAALIEAVGGLHNSNVIVVSDHGFAPFHTAVNLNQALAEAGLRSDQVKAVTSGPAANIYINLKGREPGGTVTPAEFRVLQKRIVEVLQNLKDENPNYTLGFPRGWPVFSKIFARPLPSSDSDPGFGLGTNAYIGQDSGDVFAVLRVGYNFDGVQNPPVTRRGDPASAKPVLSLPNFYGAHGYMSTLPEMSAVLYAAGPDIRRRGSLGKVRNIDLAPSILALFGVTPAATVEGRALPLFH
ncbi:alkaline phosphatase family protein [Candidatus Methylocalor cossyra]|uniref:Phosphodiesterase n=1 Tax=Candidatus Methylocalor cossyra TaxID=3108543 RepID=A0ABP1C5W7_9GAMM